MLGVLERHVLERFWAPTYSGDHCRLIGDTAGELPATANWYPIVTYFSLLSLAFIKKTPLWSASGIHWWAGGVHVSLIRAEYPEADARLMSASITTSRSVSHMQGTSYDSLFSLHRFPKDFRIPLAPSSS